MTIFLILLTLFITFIYLKLRKLEKLLLTLSFSERIVNKVLIDKKIITSPEIDTVMNNALGKMLEEQARKIINDARDVGLIIPEYMSDEELKIYLKQKDKERKDSEKLKRQIELGMYE